MVSKTFIAVLVILTIIISVVSTYVVLENVDAVRTTGHGSNYGTVGVNVVPKGHVGVNVVNPETNQ